MFMRLKPQMGLVSGFPRHINVALVPLRFQPINSSDLLYDTIPPHTQQQHLSPILHMRTSSNPLGDDQRSQPSGILLLQVEVAMALACSSHVPTDTVPLHPQEHS